ncbi:MAG TPA: SRPBCC family protein [Ktedonobacterales bacterium]|nr:SRPBCC family protein [Ktedonobacterales bacterium]
MIRRDATGEWMARGMGLISLGLGLPSLAVPGTLARTAGLRDDSISRTLLTAVGLRETTLGIGILSLPRFAGWMWMRMAGDVMDLAILGTALATSKKRQRNLVAAVIAGVVGATAIDMWTAIRLSRRPATRALRRLGEHEYKIEAKRAITVNRPREEVYQAWRDFRNLPRFMEHLESVEITAEDRSHWVAKAPAGATVEWDAEITDDQPNDRISWHSLPDSRVDNAGTVRFVTAPGDKGTEIHIEIRYNPPGGRLGATVAKIFGKEPGQQVASDLRRFKQVMETGEIARSEVSARGGGPAQPSKRPIQVQETVQIPTTSARR